MSFNCFSNGISGRYDINCEDFLDGTCSEGAEMIDNMSIKLVRELYEEYQDPFRAARLNITTPELNKHEFLKEEFGYK